MHPIPAHKKMKLSDLRPATKEADYSEIDNLIYKECQELLASGYLVGKAILDSKVTENENISEEKVLGYMRSIASDQTILVEDYNKLVTVYENGKKKNKLVNSEDYHYFQLEIGQMAQDWIINYNDLVSTSINDLTDYINSNVEEADKITLPTTINPETENTNE